MIRETLGILIEILKGTFISFLYNRIWHKEHDHNDYV